jgi:hypothetical protein
MITTPKTFLVLCRRMWAARELRDRLMRGADPDAYLWSRRRAAKLERLVLNSELP